MSNKSTAKEFIQKAKKMHGDKYDYSLVDYQHYKTKVKIICNSCKSTFEQTPCGHLSKYSKEKCLQCSLKNRSYNRSNLKEFTLKAKKIHGNKYDYSLVDYKHSSTKVTIICNTCKKTFEQTPSCHLCGSNCPHCDLKKRFITQEEFIKRSKKVHKNRYDYSKVIYKGTCVPVEIFCNTCKRSFNQQPRVHTNQKSGCPYCRESHGEKKIANLLNFLNLKFIRQKSFSDCKSSRNYALKFDFYLPSLNLCIEYDGEQHFDKKNKWYSKYVEENDQIKNEYCKENGIVMKRISYKDFKKIEKLVKSFVLDA